MDVKGFFTSLGILLLWLVIVLIISLLLFALINVVGEMILKRLDSPKKKKKK